MKLHEPFTFFVDRSLGRHAVVDALRAAGYLVEAHDDHYPQDTPDAQWLQDVGKKGWVVLAKDKAVRTNKLELAAILAADVACFSLGRGDANAATMATMFVQGMPLIHRALRRFSAPLVAVVTASQILRVHWANGEHFEKPKEIKK